MIIKRGQEVHNDAADQKLSKPELLAPAGNFAAFEAAIEQGADAVYVGAPGFNARALSRDFTFAEIGFMIKEAHACGVRLFVAMNSIIREEEMAKAVEALSILAGLRPDALIIQDLGLLFIAGKWFPEIPLHASTLMAATSSLAVNGFTDLGFSRVVLARELTIDEISRIQRQTGADIEIFVHGAMCFSYSGLCLFSSLHGGKSSLRGQCVQPCRRDYLAVEHSERTGRGVQKGGGEKGKGKGKRKYLFSMHDLCAIDVLPELSAAGVACLKIEGRLKSSSYVANCVSAYRMALDCMDEAVDEQERVLREAHRLLDAAMARKRSSGYLFSANPDGAVSPDISGASGQFLGWVKKISFAGTRSVNPFRLLILLVKSVSVGDRLRFHDDQSGKRTNYTLRFIEGDGGRRRQAQAGEKVWLGMGGDQKSISRNKFHVAEKQRPVNSYSNPHQGFRSEGQFAKGSLYLVDLKSRINIERKGIQHTKHLKGTKMRADAEQVNGILQELAWRKQLHNKQIDQVKKDQHPRGRQNYGRKKTRTESGAKTIPCWLAVRSLHDLKQRLPFRPARLLLPLNKDNMRALSDRKVVVKKHHPQVIWQLPPVIDEARIDWFKDKICNLVEGGFHRFELGHISQYALFSGCNGNGNSSRCKTSKPVNLELFGHYSLNIINSAALQMVEKVGLCGVVFSLETESTNLKAALNNFGKDRRGHGAVQRVNPRVHRSTSHKDSAGLISKFKKRSLVGLYVYGHPPLFTSRLNPSYYSHTRQVKSPKEECFTIDHGDGLTKVRSVLPFSLLHLNQEIIESGIDYMVFDLSGGPIKQEIAIVNSLMNNPGKRRQQVLSGNYHGTMV